MTGDPAATVSPDAVDLLIDNVPGFLAPRLGRAPDVAYRARIRTTGPDRDYLLIAADPVSMTDWPGDGGGADTEISMPSEALLRLAYGRLDPGTRSGRRGRPGLPGPAAHDVPGFLAEDRRRNLERAAPGQGHAGAAVPVVVQQHRLQPSRASASSRTLWVTGRRPTRCSVTIPPAQPGLDGRAAAQDALGNCGIGSRLQLPASSEPPSTTTSPCGK